MHKDNKSRRSFLKQVLAGTAVAAAVVPGVKRAGAAEKKFPARPDEVLYNETEAFRQYYRSLR